MKKAVNPLLIVGGLVLLAVIAGVVLLAKNFLSGGFHGTPSNIQESILEKTLPKTDIVSEDVSGTSKYDDMIRVVYSSDDCSEESMYYKEGNMVDNAYNYYKNDLTGKGWQVISENHIDSLPVVFQGVDVTVENIKQMTLQKGDEELVVATGTVNFAGKTYTLVHVEKSNLNCQVEENYTEENEAQSQTDFSSIKETDVAGFQATLRDLIKPSLVAAFGDAKLVDATSISSTAYAQQYYVKNQPDAASVQAFVDDIANKGFQILVTEFSSESEYTIGATKEIDGNSYVFSFRIHKTAAPTLVDVEVMLYTQ